MHDTSVNCYQIKKKVYIFEITVIYTCKNERYLFDRVTYNTEVVLIWSSLL